MNKWSIDSAFPEHQVEITPNDDAPLDRPMIIVALTDGNVQITDKFGVSVTYAVTAGWESRIPAVVVGEDTTAEVVGIY